MIASHWYRFQQLFSMAAPVRRGLLAITAQEKIIHGAVGGTAQDPPDSPGFADAGAAVTDLASTLERLLPKYDAKSCTLIERDDLLKHLIDLPASRTNRDSDRLYAFQLERLRQALGLDGGKRSLAVEYRGPKPFADSFPRHPFLFYFLRHPAIELLPENKHFLIIIIDEDTSRIDSLLLELRGRAIERVMDPDWASFDWRSLINGFISREGSARIVQWCESKYRLPTYAAFFSREAWEKATYLHNTEGLRPAWRYLWGQRTGGELGRQVLFEPEPAPLKALSLWLAFGRGLWR